MQMCKISLQKNFLEIFKNKKNNFEKSYLFDDSTSTSIFYKFSKVSFWKNSEFSNKKFRKEISNCNKFHSVFYKEDTNEIFIEKNFEIFSKFPKDETNKYENSDNYLTYLTSSNNFFTQKFF